MPNRQGNEVTEEWLVWAIGFISEGIIKHGPVYAPLLDRLERELEKIRSYEDPIVRARRHLARRDAQ